MLLMILAENIKSRLNLNYSSIVDIATTLLILIVKIEC